MFLRQLLRVKLQVVLRTQLRIMSNRKRPAEDNPNSDFCNFLSELAEYEKNINRNIYKHNAYRKAANVLAALPTRIASGEEAKKLNGIGDKIAKKIDEFLQTGKLKKLENIHSDDKAGVINLLTRVSGLGPVKAQKLYDMGVRSIEDLRRHTDKLSHHQIIGLKYFEDFEQRIPRAEIQQIEKITNDIILKVDTSYKMMVCGSYRRGKSESGDVDILVTHPHSTKISKQDKMLTRIIEALQKHSLVIDKLAVGDTKFMGVCKLNNDALARRIDIRFIPKEQYYCAILYFTGSDMFNKEMRAHALERGFTLNEYYLRPVGSTGVAGEPIEINCERDIFDCIDFEYREPQDRN